jgi:hypothetical protein
VQNQIHEDEGVICKRQMIKDVLKKDFDYTYRKIKRISFQGNS